MQEQEQHGSGFAQADRQTPGAGPSGRGGPPQDQCVWNNPPSTSAADAACEDEDVDPRLWKEFDPEVSNEIVSSMQHIHGDAVVMTCCVMQAGEVLLQENLQHTLTSEY